MKYGYYIKINKGFNLEDALDLFNRQKYTSDRHTFIRVYNNWKHVHDRDYLVIHDNIFEPEYHKSGELESLIRGCSSRNWKWKELKLNYKDLGEI